MQKYTKNYIESLGKTADDYFLCEEKFCTAAVVDVHHVTPRSLGGSDQGENLIGFCRCHHDASGPGRPERERLNRMVRERMGDKYQEGFDLKINLKRSA